jgi:hypothetical protein
LEKRERHGGAGEWEEEGTQDRVIGKELKGERWGTVQEREGPEGLLFPWE